MMKRGFLYGKPLCFVKEAFMKQLSKAQMVKKMATQIGNNMTDMQFFLSSAVNEHFKNTVMALTRRYGSKKIQVHIINADEGITAYTDHSTITINANCGMLNNLNRPEKFLAISGFCFHETGHCLYTDRKVVFEIMEELKNNNTLLYSPTEDWDELKDFLQDGKHTNSFISVWKQIWNILEDGYIEYRFLDEHKQPIFSDGLIAMRNLHINSFISLEEYVKSETDDSKKLLTIENLLLAYCKYGKMLYTRQSELQDERMQALFRCMPYIDEVNATYESDTHYVAINNVIAILSPYILEYLKAMPDDKDGGSGQTENEQSQIGGGNSTSDAPTSSSNATKPMAGDKKGSSNMSNGKKENPENTPNSNSNSSENNNSVPNSENSNDEKKEELSDDAIREATKKMQELLDKESTEQAKQSLEQTAANELNSLDSSINKGSSHKGITANVNRVVNVPECAKNEYDALAPKINQMVKVMVKGVKQILKDRRTGGVQRGLYFGKSINPVSYSRHDKKYFQNKKLPTNAPTMSVALVIDESGSMHGDRIHAAKILALTLYRFCRELDIRVCIVGHSTGYNSTVELFEYCDFDGSFDNKDLYRILTMQNRNRNRDGYAIRHVIGRLEKEDADMKLCFVVSDGKPNHDGYHASEAKEDFKSIKKLCHSKNISLIAAAIGEDKDLIKSFYGEEAFLDIADLNNLPKAVIGKIKQFLPKTI